MSTKLVSGPPSSLDNSEGASEEQKNIESDSQFEELKIGMGNLVTDRSKQFV